VYFAVKVTTQQALAAKAWPFEEARKLLARVEARKSGPNPIKSVLFETGYGPSGLSHIGTFGEVARPKGGRRRKKDHPVFPARQPRTSRSRGP